jgi:hypothetical protein
MRDTLDLQVRQATEQLEALIVEKERLSLVWTKGRLSDKTYEDEIARIESEEARLKSKLAEKESQLSSLDVVVSHRLLSAARQIASGEGDSIADTDPDNPLGHEVWRIRRQLIRELGAEVLIQEREIIISVGIVLGRPGGVFSDQDFS